MDASRRACGHGCSAPSWRIGIDNHPDFTTAATGQAFVTSADINPREVEHLFSISPQPGHARADLQRLHVARLWVLVEFCGRDAATDRIAITADSLTIGE